MGSFRVGSILSFEIRIDYSWFVIVGLIIWSFSAGVFPAEVPGLPTAVYVVMGVGGALLFFASLLGHELAHSVVAKRKGIEVEGITLFIFGGVARTRSEARTPGEEFQIAGVGPLASLVIGGLMEAVAVVGATVLHPAVLAVLHYLAFLNVFLAVFNLLPGFPLDGGRVFRSILWKLTGNLDRATRIATTAGKGLGWLMIGAGAFAVLEGRPGGLWSLFIGWYLRNAAVMSYRQHRIVTLLSDVSAAQAMSPSPEDVPADMTLERLMRDVLMRSRHVAFPAVSNGAPVGMVTLQQLHDVPRADWSDVTVADVMMPLDPLLVVGPADSLAAVVERLQTSPTRRVLVMEGGRLVGLITADDVTHWLERARQMQELPTG